MRLSTCLAAVVTLLGHSMAIKTIDGLSCFGDTNIPFVDAQYLAFGDKPNGATRPTYWCYGEAGQLDIPSDILWDVTTFNSGNNAGYFEYEPGDGSRYRHTFDKHQSQNYDFGRVSTIHIN